MAITEPLHYRNLAAVAELIARRDVSSEDVMRHTLARIAAYEARLYAYVEVRAEQSMTEAKAADARQSRGEALGALHGVPIAVKDLCAMAGTKTRAGGFFRTRFKDSDTATVVRRLQEAGAIIIGKTQLTEGAWGAHHPDITPPVISLVANTTTDQTATITWQTDEAADSRVAYGPSSAYEDGTVSSAALKMK